MQSRRTSTQVQAPDTPPHSTSWKTEDDTQLTQARAQGLGWSQIAQNYFPNKTPNACRKRNERLMENQSQRNWDSIRIEALAIAYAEVREEMWKLLAVKVGEKWLVVESKVSWPFSFRILEKLQSPSHALLFVCGLFWVHAKIDVFLANSVWKKALKPY